MNHFAGAVSRARRKSGWTMQQIADSLGVQLCTVRSWMKDPTTNRSAREAPEWATLALWSLIDGRPRSERRGALVVTYAPVKGWEGP